jgi:hypothetical protein
MVQSWENFMRPDGGYRQNSFVDGTGAIVGGLIADSLGLGTFDSLSKADRQLIRERASSVYQRRLAKIQGDRALSPEQQTTRIQEMRTRLGRNTAARMKGVTASGVSAARLMRGISFAYLGVFAAQMVADIATPGLTPYAQRSEMARAAPLDSNQAYTQRQRALQAIHESQLGIRNVIGNEASLFHR